MSVIGMCGFVASLVAIIHFDYPYKPKKQKFCIACLVLFGILIIASWLQLAMKVRV